jgi:hypothetical protein
MSAVIVIVPVPGVIIEFDVETAPETVMSSGELSMMLPSPPEEAIDPVEETERSPVAVELDAVIEPPAVEETAPPMVVFTPDRVIAPA